jgi:hypothetical protein
MVKMTIADVEDFGKLMDSAAYSATVA